MIDPMTEDLVFPSEATRYYPRRADGRKVHVATVHRHMKHGSRGIILESIRTPRLATSRQAISRFFRRLSESESQTGSSPPSRPARAITTRDVEKELDRLGL